MKSDVLRHGHFPADYRGGSEHRALIELTIRTICLLNPLVGWSIALLISAGLWWGIEVAVSSVVSVVL